ncbi:venom serine protease isoform X2 [Halyomorpha halys]
MKCLQIVLLLFTLSGFNRCVLSKNPTCECGWRNRARIIGGKETCKNEFPWMVAIGDMKPGHFSQFCGGSIITPWHILTAAHCTDGKDSDEIVIITGGHDITDLRDDTSELVTIEQVIEHEDYDKIALINDIAMLIVSKQILFNNNVGPVCLPNRRIDLVDQFVKVTGWGLTTYPGKPSAVLRQVNLKVIPHNECKKFWPDISETDPPTQLCTFRKNKDSCFQDSGGPLVWLDPDTNRFIQVALVSYGGKCGKSTPAVNTAVFPFIEWINSNIEESKPEAQICTVGSISSPHGTPIEQDLSEIYSLFDSVR